MLLNYHIGRFVLGLLYVGDLARLGLSSIRVAGLCCRITTLGRFVLGLLCVGDLVRLGFSSVHVAR